MYPDKKVLVLPRQGGKTTQALKWVEGGEKCDGYPGWTRVLIVPSVEMDLFMRKMVAESTPTRPLRQTWWSLLEDWSHRVFPLQDFERGRFPSRDTEYAIDDFDLMLARDPQLLGKVVSLYRVTHLTITGEAWT